MDDATLLTPRLRLRLLDADDSAHAELYRALYTSADVMAEIGPVLEPGSADALCLTMSRHNRLKAPGHRTWVVEERPGSRCLGLVALCRRDLRAELGLMLVPDAWTGRISTQALAPVIAFGFESMGLECIDAGCRDGRNTRISRRLLAPFPFQPVATAKPGTSYWTLQRAAWAAWNDCPDRVALGRASG